MKTTINQENMQVNMKDETLYDIIYNLFFFAKIKESEESTKRGKVCTLQGLRQHIDELEEKYGNNNIRWCEIGNYRYI